MQDKKVTAFIEPPKKIPLFLKIGIYISNKVTIASTSAQVNYWTRLIQALGVPPAGFSDKCDI